jgi:hypothetical protein
LGSAGHDGVGLKLAAEDVVVAAQVKRSFAGDEMAVHHGTLLVVDCGPAAAQALEDHHEMSSYTKLD